VITLEEFANLIGKKSTEKASSTIPKEVQKIFDYQSPWFSQLPSPTQNYFKHCDEGVQAFQSGRDNNEYKLKDAKKFNLVCKQLESEHYNLSVEMERLKLKALDLANLFPLDPAQAQQFILKMEAGTVNPINFESLVTVFIKGDLQQYRKLNPNMSMEDAKELDQHLQTFIDLVPEWQYRQRLIASMQSVNRTKSHPIENQEALKNFVKSFEADRKFPHEAKRLMKVMEYQTSAYYRGGQVEKLGKLGFPGLKTSPTADVDNISVVDRTTVGGGKTSRLLPSMLKHYGEEGKLALAIMPEAQLASAGKELEYIMKKVYQIPTLETDFTLQKSTPENLESIAKELEKAILNGYPVLTSGKSLKVLRNLYIENKLLLISKSTINDLPRKVQALETIMTMIKSSTPIIDEVHKVFDPKVETNHPSGMAASLPQEYGVITLNLYEILLENEIQGLMHFNFFNQAPIKGAAPFSQERFKSKIAPILIQKMLKRLENTEQIDPELNILSNFYRVNKDRKEDIENYLLNKCSDEVVAWVEQQFEVRDQLALIRGQVSELLPSILSKKFGERYGFVNEIDILPTPFSSGEPNFGSQFSLPFATYDYLLQALTHEGLRKSLFEKIVLDLQKERLKNLTELAAKGRIPALGERIETEADDEFKRLFKTESWNLDTPDIAKKLFDESTSHPDTFRHLVKTYALQQVKVFPMNLKATSQHLGNMVKIWFGLSGTPNNYPTYPGDFIEPQDKAVIGRMLTLMAEQTFNKTHILKARNPKELLNDERFLRCDAFMDAGGLFAGENLELIGDTWSAKTGKAIVLVDRQEGILIKQADFDKALPLRASTISPHQRVALMGQADITGTDISYKANAIGMVSISASSTLTSVEQAAGRMRGIESGQTVEFLVLEDDAILIRESLGLPPSHELTSEDILRNLMINESEKQMEDSEIALHHKLQGVIDNFAFNWLQANSIKELENKPEVVEFLTAIFSPMVVVSPFELFGRNKTPLSKEIAFTREINSLIGPNSTFVTKATPVFGEQMESIVNSLKLSMETILSQHLKYINETVTFSPSTEMEQQQELNQHVHIEQNQQQHVETELYQEKVEQPPMLKAPHKHRHWGDSKIYELNKETIASSLFYENALVEKYLTKLSDVLAGNSETKILENFFSIESNDTTNNLFVSCNFQQDVILNAPQKPAQFVLIAFNKEKKHYTLAFIDSKEALNFKQAYHAFKGEKLPNLFNEPNVGKFDRYERDRLKDLQVFEKHEDLNVNQPTSTIIKDKYVYYDGEHFQYGSIDQPKVDLKQDTEIWVGDFSGKKSFGNDSVLDLQNAELSKLWIRAQIFAGRFNFANEEEYKLARDLIDDWSSKMSQTQSKSKLHFLTSAEQVIKKIASSKEDMLTNYPKTDLGKIFAELKHGSSLREIG
jgi:hypothetical protein